jgi:hypothetical protein
MGLAPEAPSMGGDQVVTGPTTAYDDATGEAKFTLGEGGAAEQVEITPLGPGAAGGSSDGEVQGYSVGGTIWSNPNYISELMAPPASGPAPTIRPPAFAGASGSNYNANPVVQQYRATQSINNAQGGINQQQGNVYRAQSAYNAGQRAALGPSSAVNQAQRATLGPAYAVAQAKGASNAARSTQNAAQGAYLAEQARENQTRQGEFAQVQAAANDPEDIKAVGQARLHRASTNQRYGELGATAPVEVEMPAGYTGPMPGGVVGKLSTHEDQLSKQFDASQKGRSFALEASRIATAQTGQAVTAADIMEGRAQLTLDMAQLAVKAAGLDKEDSDLALRRLGFDVNDAELGLRQAGLAKDYAQLDLSRAKEPGAPGEVMYQDPQTGLGTWMTPLQRAQRMREDELTFGYANNATQYSQDPTYGHLSDSEMVSALVAGSGNVTLEGVIAELIKRRYTPEQANGIAQAAIARQRGGGGAVPTPPQLGGR